jgi:hypothetical protein
MATVLRCRVSRYTAKSVEWLLMNSDRISTYQASDCSDICLRGCRCLATARHRILHTEEKNTGCGVAQGNAVNEMGEVKELHGVMLSLEAASRIIPS